MILLIYWLNCWICKELNKTIIMNKSACSYLSAQWPWTETWYLNSCKFYTSQPIQGNHTSIISLLQQPTQSWCQFHPMPAETIQISVFELVSSKTTHSSIWCQMHCKTRIWATCQGRCQLQGIHPIRVDRARKPHMQMIPRGKTSRLSPPTTLPRWRRQVQHSLLHHILNPMIKWHKCF